MSTTHSSFDQYCISHKTISHRAAAAPGPEVRRECPMTYFPALPFLATNPGDATAQRINFKLAKLCYLVTSFQQPSNLISLYSQSRLLRSSTQKFLSVPPHNLDTAARRFSVAAPRLWNSLPLNCRTAPSVNTFKIRLKTFLFDSA